MRKNGTSAFGLRLAGSSVRVRFVCAINLLAAEHSAIGEQQSLKELILTAQLFARSSQPGGPNP